MGLCYGATEAGPKGRFSVFSLKAPPQLGSDQLEVVLLDLDRAVVVGEHSDELITRIGPISAAEDTGTGDIGVLDLGCEVAGVAVELQLILGGIKVGDVGVIAHALRGIEALLFIAEDKDITAATACEHINLSAVGFCDGTDQQIIGITADHAVAVGGASVEHITIDADVRRVGAIGAEAEVSPTMCSTARAFRCGADLISRITVNFNQRLASGVVIDGINGEVG